MIGYEYNVIGWCKNRTVLGCEWRLIELLSKICNSIGMRQLSSGSVTVECDLNKLDREQFQDEGGVTAYLILSTSHIAIHGWPYRDMKRDDGGYFWLNVCSCRSFNNSVIDSTLKSALNTTNVDTHMWRYG